MTKISFIYFDVGGVVIKDFSDSPKWDVMLNGMGIDETIAPNLEKDYDLYDTQACCGKCEIDDIIPLFIDKYHLAISREFSILQYFIDHFEQNPTIWPLIESIQKYTRVGLLTDMYPRMFAEITTHKLLPPNKWDTIIDSSLVGFRKPMPEIYQIAQVKAKTPAEEILFIDNRQKNLVPARALGWQTFLYDSKNYDKSSHDLATYLQLPGL